MSTTSVFAGMQRSYANEVRNTCRRCEGEDGDEDAVYELDNDKEGDEDEGRRR
jgi:hypothetical protein